MRNPDSNYVGPYPAPGFVTMTDFAESLGMDRTAILKMVKRPGFEPAFFKDKGGRYHIDPVKGKELYHATLTRVPKPGEEKGGPPGAKANTYVDARTQNEILKTHLQKLTLDERRKNLIAAKEAEETAFIFARAVRDRLLALPDRLSAELAAMSDDRKVHARLNEEIKKALSSVEEILRDKANETT